MNFERIQLSRDPYLDEAGVNPELSGDDLGKWPCRWIHLAEEVKPPFVAAYRCVFQIDAARTVRVHVTADERYELYLDGRRIGRGSERSDLGHWCFETYDLHLEAGAHVLATRVWSQGEDRAFAQMSLTHGFLLSPQAGLDQKLMGTGVAPWMAKRLGGYTFISPLAAWGTGQNVILDGAELDDSFAVEGGTGWNPVRAGWCGLHSEFHYQVEENQHLLRPALLPAMLEEERLIGRVRHVSSIPGMSTAHLPIRESDHLADEQSRWQAWLSGAGPLRVHANTTTRVLIDLENYYCAYPKLVVSGGRGAAVRIHWQEALLEAIDSKKKGNRDEIYGKHFVTLWSRKDGIGDTFKPDGSQNRTYEPLWWQAGRYVEVVVATGAEDVVLERLSFMETRYPMENESAFRTSRSELNEMVPLLARSLHMSSHETYVDCPFYEQLAYIGDSRLEALLTYVTSSDDRLPRKTLLMFDWSRLISGFTQSRYPSRVPQMIPPFSLWWVCMVHDYALWRGDPAFVRSLMPGVRAVLDAVRGYQNQAGLIAGLPGWNFVDWVPQWPSGIPPDGVRGASCTINGQAVLAGNCAAELEAWLGEPDAARRQKKWAEHLVRAMDQAFWDPQRQLYADDAQHRHFSLHAQALALLGGKVPEEHRAHLLDTLLHDDSLPRPSIYFKHYILEALQSQGKAEAIPSQLDLWLNLRTQGFKTTFEGDDPNETRSDCHGWGAHPLYHYFASLAGIRPGRFGFDHIVVNPRLGELGWAEGELPHPRGVIRFRLEEDAGTLQGELQIPSGTTASVHFDGAEQSVEGHASLLLKSKIQPGERAEKPIDAPLVPAGD